MLQIVLDFVRSWFPPDDPLLSARKRRLSANSYSHRLPNKRMRMQDDYMSPLKSVLSPRNSSVKSIILDDEDELAAPKSVDTKLSKRFSSPHKENESDLSVLKIIKSTTEKKLDAKKSGYEYITRFTSSAEPLFSAKSKMRPHRRISSQNNSFSSPTLSSSIRLDDKQKYDSLLKEIELQNNASFNCSSIYGTPRGSPLNRSGRILELARRKPKVVDTIDLTSDVKGKLSTKDRVIKILDNFDTEDSDSDVEVLPTPPSPKPDIKVSPVNSLKPAIYASQVAHKTWLDDVTKKHQQFLDDKSKEVQLYQENSTSLSKINHDILLNSLSRKVKNCLAIKDEILPVIEVEEETVLPTLTDEQLRMVKRAFSGDPNEVLSKKFSLNLNRRDIQTLQGLNWLNDNVINFYMNLIIERSTDSSKWPKAYAFNTFFYQKLINQGPESLKRWTKKIDLFSYEFVCVPIHLGMHWCMAIVNLKEKTIKYYDSMGKRNDRCLNALREYLEFEHMDKKKEAYSTKDFVLENEQNIPQQMNGSDCGMFSCMFAEYATRKSKFNFQQSDMPYFRKKMVVEILCGQLLIQ